MPNLKFKIGADPEFNLELDGKKLDASGTIRTLLDGNKKYKFLSKQDGRSGGYQIEKYGDIGWDGHNATAEIRPTATNDPEELKKNMGEILKTFYNIAPNFQMSTLSRYAPIGGHIHFELSEDITEDPDTMKTKVQGIHKRMISFMLPLTLGENKVNLMVRLKNSYGDYCTPDKSFRVERQYTKPNGDNGYTYELRSPSAEWLTTPKLTKATLCYLATIYHEITNNAKKFNANCKDIIIRTNDMGNALQSLALEEYKVITTAVYNKIRKYIKTFELYETYKNEIDYILNPNRVLKDKQDVNYDIRIGWGLQEKVKEACKRKILSEKEFIKISKEKDLESLSKIFTIDYNNDLNVKTFVEVLSQKIAAFNWKLNKQYFFFGIRKGIDGYIAMDKEQNIIQGLEIAKTTSDKATIEKIMKNIFNKYNEEYNNQEKSKLNFITGKIERALKDLIVIGIPYKDRIELNTKKFIETIYNIDKNQIKQNIDNKTPLIDDSKRKEEDKGEIYKIVNKLEKESKEKDIGIEADDQDERRTNEIMQTIERESDWIDGETKLLERTKNLMKDAESLNVNPLARIITNNPTVASINNQIDQMVDNFDADEDEEDSQL